MASLHSVLLSLPYPVPIRHLRLGAPSLPTEGFLPVASPYSNTLLEIIAFSMAVISSSGIS